MVRVRFAPSPTGPLHPGGARTAWYNYVFAKQNKGSFILRIEDTDQKRLVEGSEAYLKEALQWLHIIPDEGPDKGGKFGPYRQSERKAIYKQYALQLIEKGAAYYAFDSVESLEAMRQKQRAMGVEAPKYNAITRSSMENAFTLSKEEVNRRIKAGVPHVIRLLVNYNETIKFKDEVRGWIQVKGASIDDKVLVKEDGMPTYHLANVVDDHLMQITHVIRGEEWLPSTPIHVLLYRALAWTCPIFVHLPLLLRSDGQGKLSKRTAVQAGDPVFILNWQDKATGTTFKGFREVGYLPGAFTNFLTLLGWHPADNNELLDYATLRKVFSLARINKAGVKFDLTKAKWFNQQYLKAMPNEALANTYLLPILQEKKTDVLPAYAAAVCGLIKDRITFPNELWEQHRYFFVPPTDYPLAIVKEKFYPISYEAVNKIMIALTGTATFDPNSIQSIFSKYTESEQVKKAHVIGLIRVAITGQRMGPNLVQIAALLGRREVANRLERALHSWHTQYALEAQ